MSCATNAILERRSCSFKFLRSISSNLMLPLSGSQKRISIWASVVFPAPEGPTKANVFPTGISTFKLSNTFFDLPGKEKLKLLILNPEEKSFFNSLTPSAIFIGSFSSAYTLLVAPSVSASCLPI